MIVSKDIRVVFDDSEQPAILEVRFNGKQLCALDLGCIPEDPGDCAPEVVYASRELELRARVQRCLHEWCMADRDLDQVVDDPLARTYRLLSEGEEALALSMSDVKVIGSDLLNHLQPPKRDLAGIVLALQSFAYTDWEILF